MKWIEWLTRNIWYYPNVIGFSNKLQPKKVGDVFLDKLAIRIYVSTKQPEDKLLPEQVIPKFLEFRSWKRFWRKQRIPTDIIEIGELKALVNKKGKARPMLLGMNVAHHDITAGSLGMLYLNGNKKTFAGSNAHVLTPDPSLSPEQIKEKRIYNPAPYFDPTKPDKNIVGYYYWHKQVKPFIPTNCKVSKSIVYILNRISTLLRRKTRFRTYSTPLNNIDFAVYMPSTPHSLKIADESINLKKAKFIGHLFAGSSKVGVICKVRYITKEGFYPIAKWTTIIKEGDKVKGCSFWCNYETEVIDSSATASVVFGKYTAFFTDVIIVKNDNIIKGGWSGSGWFKIE